jgi:hypothetical protein
MIFSLNRTTCFGQGRQSSGHQGPCYALYNICFSYIIFSPLGSTQAIVCVYFTTLYRALASSRTRLLDHIQRRATVGRTPLNERSVRR